jgi:hypothetical protein
LPWWSIANFLHGFFFPEGEEVRVHELCGLICGVFGVVLSFVDFMSFVISYRVHLWSCSYLLSSYVYGGGWENEGAFKNSSLLFFFSLGAQVHLCGMRLIMFLS